ncbi:hypothetical protein [Lacipirellula sp.]|uniref:hypothetical protein n=1 Tax=Lacipirellula sp. TaxID=2691419 RepID=UPI003D0D1747
MNNFLEEPRSRYAEYFWLTIACLIGFLVALAILYAVKSNKVSSAPLLPMLRPSHSGIGYVLMLQNASDRPLRQIDLYVTDPSDGSRMAYTVPLIGPGEIVEVGWLEAAWIFERDQVVAIEVKGFERIEGGVDATLKVQEEWYDSKFKMKSRQ